MFTRQVKNTQLEIYVIKIFISQKKYKASKIFYDKQNKIDGIKPTNSNIYNARKLITF